jgi:hypothetical protein
MIQPPSARTSGNDYVAFDAPDQLFRRMTATVLAEVGVCNVRVLLNGFHNAILGVFAEIGNSWTSPGPVGIKALEDGKCCGAWRPS